MSLRDRTFQDLVKAENAPVVHVSPWFEFLPDGKRGKQLGTSYDILLVDDNCDKLRVHVPDMEPAISEEEIINHNAAQDFIQVKFSGFSAKMYVRDAQIGISAKAEKILRVSNNQGAGGKS